MANASFLDYRMPTSLDVPMIDTIIVEVPNPLHPFGVRGVGEPPIVPPPAAIANAIYARHGRAPDAAADVAAAHPGDDPRAGVAAAMATVSIPQLLRPSAEGRSSVEAHGATVKDVIDDLVRQFPGLEGRIIDGEGRRPEILIAVGADEVFNINQAVPAGAEVFILPAIAGG